MLLADIEDLRKRLIVLTYNRNMELLAPEVGVSHATLYKFRNGGIPTVPMLDKIETWCDAQERRTV